MQHDMASDYVCYHCSSANVDKDIVCKSSTAIIKTKEASHGGLTQHKALQPQNQQVINMCP
jgi:hypothetical protein